MNTNRPSRIAALWLPALPLQAVLRAHPELRGQPLVITDGEGGRAAVSSVAQAAARLGARIGMTAAQAQATSGQLVLRALKPSELRAATDALLDVASAFSPAVQPHGEGAGALLEVGDLGQLFPTEDALAAAIAARAEAVGLRAHIAIAGLGSIAQVLARVRPGCTVVPPGAEHAALAPLPLRALTPSRAHAALLAQWGLQTVGEFAALPRKQLAARLGAAGSQLHRLACGEDTTPLSPVAPPLAVREEIEFDDPLDNLEPLAFVLRGALDRLVARLVALGLVCGDFTVKLELATSPRRTDERLVSVAAPTREVAALLELARLALASRPPDASVLGVTVETTPARPRAVQLSLLAPSGPQPEKLATTLARLAALCGAERVGQPACPDTHLPGAAAVLPFAPPPSAVEVQAPGQKLPVPPPLLSAHVLRPPRAAEVACHGAAIRFLRAGTVASAVVRAGGPYRLRGGADGAVRDYYDVELEDGALYRLYREAESWFLDARYD